MYIPHRAARSPNRTAHPGRTRLDRTSALHGELPERGPVIECGPGCRLRETDPHAGKNINYLLAQSEAGNQTIL